VIELIQAFWPIAAVLVPGIVGYGRLAHRVERLDAAVDEHRKLIADIGPSIARIDERTVQLLERLTRLESRK
jgi:hypothetical protein